MSAAAICTSYIAEILQGIHLAADVYKIALFTSSASLDNTTTAYLSHERSRQLRHLRCRRRHTWHLRDRIERQNRLA